MEKLVIALGGNALQEAGKPATAESQLDVVEKTSEYIADIIEAGYGVIVAHGNGPQVGLITMLSSTRKGLKNSFQLLIQSLSSVSDTESSPLPTSTN